MYTHIYIPIIKHEDYQNLFIKEQTLDLSMWTPWWNTWLMRECAWVGHVKKHIKIIIVKFPMSERNILCTVYGGGIKIYVMHSTRCLI